MSLEKGSLRPENVHTFEGYIQWLDNIEEHDPSMILCEVAHHIATIVARDIRGRRSAETIVIPNPNMLTDGEIELMTIRNDELVGKFPTVEALYSGHIDTWRAPDHNAPNFYLRDVNFEDFRLFFEAQGYEVSDRALVRTDDGDVTFLEGPDRSWSGIAEVFQTLDDNALEFRVDDGQFPFNISFGRENYVAKDSFAGERDSGMTYSISIGTSYAKNLEDGLLANVDLELLNNRDQIRLKNADNRRLARNRFRNIAAWIVREGYEAALSSKTSSRTDVYWNAARR